jgi:hypothetical protein
MKMALPLIHASSHGVGCHQKQPDLRQQRLKRFGRSARAGIVATELFMQVLVTMHNALASLDAGLGWIALTTLAGDLESKPGLCGWISFLTPC